MNATYSLRPACGSIVAAPPTAEVVEEDMVRETAGERRGLITGLGVDVDVCSAAQGRLAKAIGNGTICLDSPTPRHNLAVNLITIQRDLTPAAATATRSGLTRPLTPG